MTKDEKNHTLVKAFALAALFVAVSKCLRFRAWRMAGGPEGEQWDKRWHGFPGPGGVLAAKRWRKLHGHKPPWFHEWPEPDREDCEESEPAEPVAEASTADALA
jgi:hypothetical protein